MASSLFVFGRSDGRASIPTLTPPVAFSDITANRGELVELCPELRGSVCSSISSDNTLAGENMFSGWTASPEKDSPTASIVKKPRIRQKGGQCRAKRPPNAFMRFRSWFLKSDKLPQITRMSQASQILGAVWHNLPALERREWHALATATSRRHEAGELRSAGELLSCAAARHEIDPIRPPSPSPCEHSPSKSPVSRNVMAVPVPESLEVRTLYYAQLALRELGHGGAALQRVKEARGETRRMRRARLEGAQEDIARLEARQRNRIARKLKAEERKRASNSKMNRPVHGDPRPSSIHANSFSLSGGYYGVNSSLSATAPCVEVLPTAPSTPTDMVRTAVFRSFWGASTSCLPPVGPSMLIPTIDTGLHEPWPVDTPDVHTTFSHPIPTPPATTASLSSDASPLSYFGFGNSSDHSRQEMSFSLFAPYGADCPGVSPEGPVNRANEAFDGMLRECGVTSLRSMSPLVCADGLAEPAGCPSSSGSYLVAPSAARTTHDMVLGTGSLENSTPKICLSPPFPADATGTAVSFPTDWDLYCGQDRYFAPLTSEELQLRL